MALILIAIYYFLSASVTHSARTPPMSKERALADLKNPKSTFSRFAENSDRFKKANTLPSCPSTSSSPSCKLDTATGPRLRKFTLTIDKGTLSTTGVSDKRDFIRVNGKTPAPPIEVNQFDVVDVTVTNRLKTETVIHWHGMLQTATTFADGVPGLSQCPIPAGKSFNYRFVAEIPGTFWYHGHIHDQYTDGLRGMLIIHRPPKADVRPRKRDATFLVAEYSPVFSQKLIVDGRCSVVHMNGGTATIVPIPRQPVLVNGVLRNGTLLTFTNGTEVFIESGKTNPCGGGGATRTEVNGNVNEAHPILVDLTGKVTGVKDVVLPHYSPYFLKSSSKNIRLRFINGAARTPFQVFVEGEDALLTEIDGSLTVPKAFSNLHFHVAQRVVFEFDPDLLQNATIKQRGYAVFYILVGDASNVTSDRIACNPNPAVGVQGCLPVRTGYIVFTDQGAKAVADLIKQGKAASTLSAPEVSRKLLKPGKTRARRATDITEANNLDTVPVDQSSGVITAEEVTHHINLTVDFLSGLFGFNRKLYSATRQYTNAPYALAGYAENLFGDKDKDYPPWGGDLAPVQVQDKNLTFSTPYGAVVEIRITGAIGHPIHLHGHLFHVVAGNFLAALRDVAVGGFTLTGGEVDLANIPPLVFRFRNNNPGAWAIHCHIDWHMDMGLFGLILEASDKLYVSGIQIPNDNFKACREFPLCDSTNVCPEKDENFKKGRQADLKSMLNSNILDLMG